MSTPRLDPFEAGVEPTAELWRRLARPFDLAPTVEAMFGLSPDVVQQLAGVLTATCDEAEALLHRVITFLAPAMAAPPAAERS